MKSTQRSVVHMSFLMVFVTACSGVPTGTNAGDPLTSEEIQAVLDALGGSLGGVTSFSAASVRGDALEQPNFSASSDPINVNLDLSVPCQSGGNVTLNGSMNGDVDPQSGEGSVDVEFVWGINSCIVPTQSTTVTVAGDPNVQFNATFDFGQDTFSMDGSQTGGFSFTTEDGRSGSCAIDLTFQSTVNFATNSASGSFDGTVCGVSGSGFQTFGGTS